MRTKHVYQQYAIWLLTYCLTFSMLPIAGRAQNEARRADSNARAVVLSGEENSERRSENVTTNIGKPIIWSSDRKAASVTVNVGKPNVWSLAQAHYLLANMRQGNRGLAIPTPSPTDLNPYSANGASTSILRSFFGAEVQYNGVAAAGNRAVLQKYETEYARRQMLQTKADAVQQQYLDAVNAIRTLTVKRDQLAVDDPQRTGVTAQITLKTAERDALNTELTSLNSQLSTAPSLGTLNAIPYPGAVAASPDNTALDALLNKLTSAPTSANPKLSASQALDTYIQLQYELIAKQLTLLRDETGPGERMIFLELPCDIYTVPKKHDDYLVQVEWQITRYFSLKEKNKSFLGASQYQELITLEDIEEWLQQQKIIRGLGSPIKERIELLNNQDYDDKDKSQTFKDAMQRVKGDIQDDEVKTQQVIAFEQQANPKLFGFEETIVPTRKQQQLYLQTGNEGLNSEKKRPEITTGTSNMHVIDVIPRQSALNVNDIQAQTKGLALAGQFWTLFGLGGKVSYQRQQTLYGQYLNQDVYASGFGKGQNFFGWTFGALPGSKRLSPGVRTTYAILNVPAEALALELQPVARVFRRKDAPPEDESLLPSVRVMIPGERTQGFWIEAIRHTQARPGQYVTTRLRGRYFSPLVGVLVDGQPLNRTVSLARHEGQPESQSGVQGNSAHQGVSGEFEYLNSRELILRFKMPEGYLGTPAITLVTPEKASAINHYDLYINDDKKDLRRLSETVETEPMFLDNLQIEKFEVKEGLSKNSRLALGFRGADKEGNKTAKEVLVTGKGFHKDMRFYVDNNRDDVVRAELVNATTFGLVIVPNNADKWRLTCRFGNKEELFAYDSSVPVLESIENLNTGKAQGYTSTAETVILRGRNLDKVVAATFGGVPVSLEEEKGREREKKDPLVLFVKVGERESEGSVRVLLKTADNKTNIADFQVPGRAIYKFVSKPPPPVAANLNPTIESVENQTTRSPGGHIDGGEIIILSGTNLGLAEKIYFGSEEVKTVVRKSDRALVVIAPKVKQAGKVKVVIITSPIAGQPRDNLDDFKTPEKAVYDYKASSN
ncbi:MAG: IPT/TIG domain-containing protein [Acidobacteria bacterium]|nr:IPT/TIG domain-containing protein [Acidobacteriota bacterium]